MVNVQKKIQTLSLMSSTAKIALKKKKTSTFGLIAECNIATDAKNDGEKGGHSHRAVRDLVKPAG